MMISDQRNFNVPIFGQPLCIGLIIAALGFGFGNQAMAPINPARDLSPRFFLWLIGWSDDVLKYNCS